jgi:hypothetical protein
VKEAEATIQESHPGSGLIPVKADPKTIYENRMETGGVEYIITDDRGKVVAFGYLEIDNFEQLVKGFKFCNYKIARIDLDPALISKDIKFARNVPRRRQILRMAIVIMLLLFAFSAGAGWLNVTGQVNILAGRAQVADNALKIMMPEIVSAKSKLLEVETTQKQMSEELETFKTQRQQRAAPVTVTNYPLSVKEKTVEMFDEKAATEDEGFVNKGM